MKRKRARLTYFRSAADDGVVLRPLRVDEGNGREIRIEYGTHTISALPKSGSRAADTKVEEVVVPGIVGILDLVSSAHLVVITNRELVAKVWGKDVFAVRDVALISLASRVEAEKGVVAARKVVDREEKADLAKSGDAEHEGNAADEGNVDAEGRASLDTDRGATDVELTDDEDGAEDAAGTGRGVENGAPRQTLLGRGAGVAKGVVTGPVKIGRFAGRWFAKGGGGGKAGTDLSAARDGEGGGAAEPQGTEKNDHATGGVDEQKATADKMQKGRVSQTRDVPEAEEQKKGTKQSVIESLTPRILRSTGLFFASSGFFFSYEHDISGSLTQKSEMSGSTPLWKRFDPMFLWNKHLLSPFVDAGVDELALPLMQGFVGQRAFTIEKTASGENDVVAEAKQDPGEVIEMQEIPAPNREIAGEDGKETREFLLTLISRRSTRRAGLRYRRRGIDEDGHVANFVETEQILSTQSWNQSEKAFSLLQIRGSMPLFFNQSPYSFKPQPISFGSEATNHAAFTRHFESLIKRYGEVQVASLVDKSATEVGIGELYGKHVQMANNGLGIRNTQIGFEWFDFHSQCKGMKFENVSILLDTLEDKLNAFGWITKQNDRNTHLQKGVLRTNCMDCLDRTNVVQSAVAGWALEQQLAALDLRIDLKKDPKTQWFNTLWADNGDNISRQYAGTAALKGDFTRTRKRNWTGALSDFSLTLTRYYNNVFGDYFMQACIDYWLGNVGAEVFEEFESEMMSQDYALDMRRVRRNGIETCVKIVLGQEEAGRGEVLNGGWTLSCPKESNTLRTFLFEECVLLLAGSGLYFCRFDWDTEKVRELERIDLRDVVGIQRGAYVTSALGEAHLDEAKNVGFVVKYRRDSGRGLVRRNTRSLGNDAGEAKDGEDTKKDEEGKDEQTKENESHLLAFKALPPHSSASKGAVDDAANLSENELVQQICADIYKTMATVRMREGEKQEDLPGVEEKDVVSAAEARKATGWGESLSYGFKRMVWS